MKTTIKTIAAVAALSAVAFTTNAQDSGAEMNPWADCGIGATIFPENGTAATLSNIIWDLGSTALTSASASESSCKGQNATVARFVTESYDNLEQDIVKGEGAHLTAMVTMMGCSADQQTATVNVIRSEFAKELSTETFENKATVQKAEAIYNIAAQACNFS